MAWNPSWGFAVESWGINFGYAIAQNTNRLRHADKWTIGAFFVIGYHRNKIWYQIHQKAKELQKKKSENDEDKTE